MPLSPRPDDLNKDAPAVEADRRPFLTLALLLKLSLCLIAAWVAYHQLSRVAFDAPSTHSNVPAIIQ